MERRKEVEEDKGRRSGTCNQAMRSTARDKKSMEKKSSTRPTMKGARVLWGRHFR